MKFPRRLLAALSVLLAAAVVTAGSAWLLVDDDTLVGWLVQRAETVTGARISHAPGASISRTLTPVLDIRELVVEGPDDRYRIETRSLQLQLSLPYLLLGRLDIPRLQVDTTRIHIHQRRPAPQSRSRGRLDLSLLRFRPVLHDVRVANIVVLLEDGKMQLPTTEISELSLQLMAGRDIPRLHAELEVTGDTLDIDVVLPELHRALAQQHLPFTVTVKGAIADSSASGQIDFSQEPARLDARLHVQLPELQRLTGALADIEVPGKLVASGRLSGPLRQPALEELLVRWHGPAGSGATLQGQVADVSDFSGMELALQGRLGAAKWLRPLLPDSLALPVSTELSAGIRGDAARLRLADISLHHQDQAGLDLRLDGQFEIATPFSTPQAENLAFALGFEAPTTRAARALIFDTVPELGAITASLAIRSTQGPPRLENIDIRTRDEAGITASLKGHIASFPLAADRPNTGYALDTVIRATRTPVIAQRVDLDVPLQGPLELRFRIEGDTPALQLNRVRLSAGTREHTRVLASGRMEFRDWKQPDPLHRIDMTLELDGSDTGFLQAWAKQELPSLAYTASARLHTVAGKHRLDDYVQETVPGEPLAIRLHGQVDNVVLFPSVSLSGIQVDVSANTEDSASLNRLFGLEDRIPAIGPLTLSFRYSGDDRKLLLSDFSLDAGQPGIMQLTARGRLGYISAKKKWHLEDTDLTLAAESDSSRAFAAALGLRLPELGPVRASASLNDRKKHLALTSLQVLVGDDETPALTASGHIGDVYRMRNLRLESTLNLDGHRLAAFADRESLPDLRPLTGSMLVSDRDGSLGIDRLRLETHAPGLLSLNMEGSYEDFSRPETLVFEASLDARDLQLLGALFDRQWARVGPVRFSGKAVHPGKQALVDANLVLGKARVTVQLHGDLARDTPYITGKVSAKNVFFRDPIDRAAEQHKAKKKKKKKREQDTPLFTQDPLPFQRLKQLDMDLDIEIESFDEDQWDARAARLQLQLDSGRLRIRPATFVYTRGTLELELLVDAAQEPPTLVLNASARNVNPWREKHSEQPGSAHYADADYDIDLSLNASGHSPHDIAASLDGGLYMTIQDGRLRRSVIDLLFVDIAGWSINMVKGSKYAPINCGVADFTVRQGVVETNAFFLDSKSITITGEGSIDLGRERVDYVFIPKKKSRIILKAEPVRIKGALADPEVKVLPVKSAALTFGTLIFAPYVFAGIVAADYASDAIRKEDSNGISACQAYEQRRREARAKAAEKP